MVKRSMQSCRPPVFHVQVTDYAQYGIRALTSTDQVSKATQPRFTRMGKRSSSPKASGLALPRAGRTNDRRRPTIACPASYSGTDIQA